MAKPKWKGYRTTKGTRINYKEDEVLPLWTNENEYGEYLSGPTKVDIPKGTIIVVYRNKYWTEEEDGAKAQAADQMHDRTTGAPVTQSQDDDDLPF